MRSVERRQLRDSVGAQSWEHVTEPRRSNCINAGVFWGEGFIIKISEDSLLCSQTLHPFPSEFVFCMSVGI
jgi:hypothetical protein